VWCKACFDILNRLEVTHGCDRQTDERTDALHYIARPKSTITFDPNYA